MLAAMNGIDQYIHAATRDNTRRAYQAAVRHFETEWGGFLPATPSSIARYLADHAETLSINTLKQRLAGLAQWHIDQGFPDPTKAPMVKKVLKGMRELHPAMERQAKPLPVENLHRVDGWITARLTETTSDAERLRLLRDRALVLLGFWRASAVTRFAGCKLSMSTCSPTWESRFTYREAKATANLLGEPARCRHSDACAPLPHAATGWTPVDEIRDTCSQALTGGGI
jgi:hypothetical protein